MAKLKVLMLGTYDSKAAGHIQSNYLRMPDCVDAQMVTLYGLYGDVPYCFYSTHKTFWQKIKLFRYTGLFFKWWRTLYCMIRFGVRPIIDKNHLEYCFNDSEFVPYSAKEILKKCPEGFIPDLITIHLHHGFISSNIVKELHKLTGAQIAYMFVDEAPMTGGCHYPVDCKNYMDGCHSCPALSRGKKLAAIQMKCKEENLKGIPMYICGSPCDLRVAKKTKLFKEAKAIPSIHNPQVTITEKEEARKELGLKDDSFIVMIGAAHVGDVRKGIIYSIEAINLAAQHIPNLVVLVVGTKNSLLTENLVNAEVIELGFVDLDRLFLSFSAADCFLSTTIADSGPMMVNYSIAIGTPVISFPIGIAEDLVIHKKTGYLAEYRNTNDLKEGLLFVSKLNSESQKQMSDDCKKLIKEKNTSWVEGLIEALGKA